METFADNVENRILQYLSEKRFSVGDLLPKEMEISKNKYSNKGSIGLSFQTVQHGITFSLFSSTFPSFWK